MNMPIYASDIVYLRKYHDSKQWLKCIEILDMLKSNVEKMIEYEKSEVNNG